MNVSYANQLLFKGLEHPETVFPRLVEVSKSRRVFQVDFGLKALPRSPGILLVRGARQYGKSTWLEGQVAATFREFGPGSVYYLNGDEIGEAKSGSTSPHEFGWFARSFPGARLKVIGLERFAAGAVSGVTMEDFLLEEE